ncbi:hypothetical protein HPB47_002641, partial [Ixodes persulcatus]
HRDWGYRINTRKGRDIAEAMEEIGLTLRNESGVKTRLAKQARQHDTTPDLTRASKEILLQNLDEKNSIEASIQQAMSKARTTVMGKPGDPTPDMHLLNFNQVQQRTQPTQVEVSLRVLEFKNRTRQGLAHVPSHGSEETTHKNAAQNLVLRLNITEDELATQAAQLFFLQANLHDRTMRHNRRGWRVRPPKEPGMDGAINMGELLEAVHTTRTNSAPGPDGVTYTALENLPAAAKEILLQECNRI